MTESQAADWVWAPLTEVFRTVFGDDGIVIGPETTARDIEGWDSIAHVQLIVAIEERFGVRFNTGEAASLLNVGQLAQMVSARARTR